MDIVRTKKKITDDKLIDKLFETTKFLPHVNVRSISEYFMLPRHRREKWGMYLKPIALPFDWTQEDIGWKAFYKKIKQLYPVQFFLRETVFSYDNPVYAVYSKLAHGLLIFRYNTERFFKPAHPRFQRACPRWKYTDISSLCEDVNFAMILDFYKDESDRTDWNDSPRHKKFFRELKKNAEYVDKGRAAIQKKCDDELTKATDNLNKNISYETRYGKYNRLEQDLINHDTRVLVWFVENRQFFWS